MASPIPGAEPIPASAYNVAAQLLSKDAGADAGTPLARMPTADGSWVRVSAARVEPEHRIAVTIEPATAAERLELFARAHGLSPRESAVVTAVAGGAATAEIAQTLHLSPYTVQDHLTAVFEKAGVRSRSALLAKATGTTTG